MQAQGSSQGKKNFFFWGGGGLRCGFSDHIKYILLGVGVGGGGGGGLLLFPALARSLKP